MPARKSPFEKLELAFDYLIENYTLFEISMILIIIGLVLGGAVLTRDLISAGELRAQIRQIQNYDYATHQFQEKYGGFPGDIENPGKFFATAVAGNGNGLVEAAEPPLYNDSVYWNSSLELQQAFVQLSLAGLADRSFDGSRVLNKGIPATIYNNKAGFFIAANIFALPSRDEPELEKGNAMWFVACNYKPGLILDDKIALWSRSCGVFAPIDLRFIDNKIDDSRPLTGKLQAFGSLKRDASGGVSRCVEKSEYNSKAGPQKICQAAYVLN